MASNVFVRALVSGAAVAAISSGAQADDLLLVDLSVTDQITVTATAGLSDATISGPNFTGFLLDGMLGAAAPGFIAETLVSGDLTTFNNPSNGIPNLFTSIGDFGLNIWNFSSDSTVSFTAGQQAFTGSGTWDIPADYYASMLAGASSGNIYFPADGDEDIPTATAIGTYRVIPAPGAMSLLGLGLVGVARRRR